jgi:site-specific DNA-methyltransferase (adenine-specific)
MTSCKIIRGDAFKVTSTWDEYADLIVTDPPYGGIVSEEWDRKWTAERFDDLTNMIDQVLTPGGTAYVWGGIGTYRNRLFFSWLSRVENSSLKLHDLITWRKKRAYGKSHGYLFTREECAMLVKGDKPKVFHIPLLDQERGYAGYNPKYPAKSKYLRRTDVWTDVTEIFKGKIHPTEKPSRLAEIMIETSSNKGDLVVDFFAGSGSTGVAAKKLGRDCVLIESSKCAMHKV